jgi:hypothetical protein
MCQSKIQQNLFTHTVFQESQVVSNTNEIEATFTSSGTRDEYSKHLVTDTSLYEESYRKGFLNFMET